MEFELQLFLTTQPLHFPEEHNCQESNLLEIIFWIEEGRGGISRWKECQMCSNHFFTSFPTFSLRGTHLMSVVSS